MAGRLTGVGIDGFGIDGLDLEQPSPKRPSPDSQAHPVVETATGDGPVTGKKRLPVLDVLRGIAIFGILPVNVQLFSGHFFLSPEQVGALPWSAADGVLVFLMHVFFEGKFYSLFSLLFGIGFGLPLARAAARSIDEDPAFIRRYRRRLLGLLAIGGLHAIFLWSGDILTLYALLGFLLMPMRHLSSKALLVVAILLLASPFFLYLLFFHFAAPSAVEILASAGGADGPNYLGMLVTGFQSGNLFEAWLANLVQLVARWIDLGLTARFPKVLGMFVLGIYASKTGLLENLAGRRETLVRFWRWGLLIGLPANVAMAYLGTKVSFLPATPLGLLSTLLATVGVPALSLAYTAGLALLFQSPVWQKRMMRLSPVGRMALSNYLLQSVFCVLVFYGIGLGLYLRSSFLLCLLVATLLVILQWIGSHLWMSRFAFGPAEWIWRQVTYGRRFPLRVQSG